MAEITVNPVPEMATKDDERFMDFTKDVANAFVELYLMREFKDDVIGRSPETPKSPIVLQKEEDIGVQDQVALEVAHRLRALGDQIDAQLKTELDQALKDFYKQRSVWDLGYSQFQGILHGVLSKCQGAIRTGWDQVAATFTLVGRLAGELRVQQGEIGGLREVQMRGYAGMYMRDTGIQEWVVQQGGMGRINEPINPELPAKVDIPDSEV